MTGYVTSASNFFFFWWCVCVHPLTESSLIASAHNLLQRAHAHRSLISMELAMNAFFRYTAYWLPSMPTAFAVSSAGTGVLLMFGAFLPPWPHPAPRAFTPPSPRCCLRCRRFHHHAEEPAVLWSWPLLLVALFVGRALARPERVQRFGTRPSLRICPGLPSGTSATLPSPLLQDYDTPIAGPGSPRMGTYFIDLFGFQNSDGWKYGGIVFLGVGYYLLFGLVLSARALWTSRNNAPVGTKRHLTNENDAAVAAAAARGGAASPVATPAAVSLGVARVDGSSQPIPPRSPTKSTRVAGAIAAAASSPLPFEPSTLVFKDVCYDVITLDKKKRRLLHGVTGIARPGTMTALMGASGAGKTTLLDVLAGRKTVGTITGDIRVNGRTLTKQQFGRVTAFAEQQDVHIPSATVREALEFSAALRLDSSQVRG
jgi:hypothetical protein